MYKLLYILFLISLTLFACSGEETVSPELAAILAPDDVNPYDIAGDSAPDKGCVRLRINGIGGTLGRVFSDVNSFHLQAARAGGIDSVEDIVSLWRRSKGIVRIYSNEYMLIDSLKHSFPYLTRDAACLLFDIGRRFSDSLDARGGGDYRLKVTSAFRTPQTVERLRRVNRNASPESAHQYATTFDISYGKFICDNSNGVRRTFEDLKNLLAEVVNDLRDQGRCYVKHERRQACLHITVIPDSTMI
ncbi:MAG: hypothetical protein J6C95_08580 [Muribaculaceae bacterium]|nr:hypothetical protein [Muribaculaceae bacterium]